jgi:hypothetical protein
LGYLSFWIVTEPEEDDSSIITIVAGAGIVPRSLRGRLTSSDIAIKPIAARGRKNSLGSRPDNDLS